MKFKPLSFLLIVSLATISCNDKKTSNDETIEKEAIAFEKSADSLEIANMKLDSLNAAIENTSREIETLLEEIEN